MNDEEKCCDCDCGCKPEVVTEVVEKIVEVDKIVEVEKVVEKIVEVEKLVEVSTGLDLSREEIKGLLSHLPSTPDRANVASAKEKLLAALK